MMKKGEKLLERNIVKHLPLIICIKRSVAKRINLGKLAVYSANDN